MEDKVEAELNSRLGKGYADSYEGGGFEGFLAGLNARAARTLGVMADMRAELSAMGGAASGSSRADTG